MTMVNNSSDVLRASSEVLSRDVRGETVLLDLKTETYFGLSGVGARAWELLGEGTSLDGMIAVLASEYGVSAEMVTRDLERFVGELLTAGLVTTNDSK